MSASTQPATRRSRVVTRLLDPVVLIALTVQALVIGGTAVAAVSITGADIRDGSIRSADIANLGVQSADLANGSVVTSKIKDGSIHGIDIADGKVGPADLAPGAITATKLADGAVTGAKLADASIPLAALQPEARPSTTGAAATLTVLPGGPTEILGEISGFRAKYDCATTGTNLVATLTLERPDASTNWGFAGTILYGPGAPYPSGEAIESAAGGGGAAQTFILDSDDRPFTKLDLYAANLGGSELEAIFLDAVLSVASTPVGCVLAGTMELLPAK